MRREALVDLGSYNEEFRYSQDRDLWLRMAQEYKFANLQVPLYKKRELTGLLSNLAYVREQRRSRALAYSRNKEIIALLWRKYRDLDVPRAKPCGTILERKAVADLYLTLGEGLAFHNQIKLARKALLISFRYYPFRWEFYRAWLRSYSIPRILWRGVKGTCGVLGQVFAEKR